MHPGLAEMVREATARGYVTRLATNGLKLRDERYAATLEPLPDWLVRASPPARRKFSCQKLVLGSIATVAIVLSVLLALQIRDPRAVRNRRCDGGRGRTSPPPKTRRATVRSR